MAQRHSNLHGRFYGSPTTTKQWSAQNKSFHL